MSPQDLEQPQGWHLPPQEQLQRPALLPCTPPASPPSPPAPVSSPPSLFSLLQVVVERYQKEKNLPPLSRTKFLVSQDLPLAQFAVTLR